jgi:hypothetical protein
VRSGSAAVPGGGVVAARGDEDRAGGVAVDAVAVGVAEHHVGRVDAGAVALAAVGGDAVDVGEAPGAQASEQVPAAHAAVWLGPVGQARSQAPQWVALVSGSTQAPAQRS